MNSMIRRVMNKRLELTYELVVKNFNQSVSELKHTTDDIESLGFKFVVHIRPKVISNDVEYMAIYFGHIKPSLTNQNQRRTNHKFFRFSIGIIDKNGNIENKKCSPFLTVMSYRALQGWDQFITHQQVLNPESGLLVESHLKLWCHLEVNDELEYIFSNSQSIANTFEKCYKSLLSDNQLSDFTIVVNQKEFPVHKAVLAARSPVFRAMITTDMKEKNESRVVLHDIDESVAEQLIYFIYTGSAPKIKQMAQQLSAQAEFFDLPDLKLFCAQTLYGELTTDNVMEALRFGETHGIRELVLNAIDFIGDHRESVRSKIIQSL